jgi:acetyl-CoA acetyltransferase
MRGTSAIVGIGESAYYRPGGSPDSELQLAVTAITNAATDAGIEVEDVDGFVSYGGDRSTPTRLSTVLGNRETRYAAMSWDGGGNNVAGTLALADAAVTAGYAEYVVCYRSLAQGEHGRFGQARVTGRERVPGEGAFRVPYGIMVPAHWYAMIAQRFMYEHAITEHALAEISLACYAHAQRNPRAIRHGRELTKDDYLNSRWIVEPFRLFDCCQENDCAAAVIVTSAERARDLPKQPVYIRSAAQGIDYRGAAGGAVGAGYNDPDFPTAHYKGVARDLWARAAVGPRDIQVAQFYENFTGLALIAMCEMGIAAPDEIEQWLLAGNARWPDGALPINTSGGNLAEAYVHGFELVNEAARQVRGESTCQVDGVEFSLVVSGPGALPASAALLSAEP